MKHTKEVVYNVLEVTLTEAKELPLHTMKSVTDLAGILKTIVSRSRISLQVLAAFPDTEYRFVRSIVLTIMCENDAQILPEFAKCFDDNDFVGNYLPKVLSKVSGKFSIQFLKSVDENVRDGLLRALLILFESPELIVLCFPLFLRVLSVCNSESILPKLKRILGSLNKSILANPQFLTLPQFPVIVFKLVQLCPSPPEFVAHFDCICLKMAASLLYQKQEAREIAERFFTVLFSKSDLQYDELFDGLARSYIAADRGPKRYAQLVESLIGIIDRRMSVKLEEIELMATITRPLLALRDPKGQKAVVGYVKLLEKWAKSCDDNLIPNAVALLAEFTAT
jgi:hypothetical protein